MSLLNDTLREQKRIDTIAAKLALPETTSDAVARLAALPPLEYDRLRQAEAGVLGIRVATLDNEVAKRRGDAVEKTSGQGQPFEIAEPDPWPEPVEGAALLYDLAATFRRFVALPEHGDAIAALWTLHTYTFAHGRIAPILAVVSPDKGCGKTTLRDTLAELARAPLPTDGISPAALFRVIEKWRPTVLLDDFDSWGRDNEELRGVLNTGHRQGGVYVRCVGDDQEPRAFATFAPKCINLIGKLHPTLADRSITITMRRKLRGERIESLHGFDGDELRRKCARWAVDHGAEIEKAIPDMLGLFNRRADNWRPLIILADLCGGDWSERVRAAVAAALESRDDDDEGAAVMLLADIRDMFAQRQADRLLSATIAETLAAMEERPWPDYRHGKPISVRQIAAHLRHFDIKPITLRAGDGRGKGYLRSAFEDAFTRYLPEEGETIRDIRDNVGGARVSGGSRSVTGFLFVTDEKTPGPAPDKDCHGVTDRIPPQCREAF